MARLHGRGECSGIVRNVCRQVLYEPNEVVCPVFLSLWYDKECFRQHIVEFREWRVHDLASNGLEFLECFGKEGRYVVKKHGMFDVMASVGC